MTRNKESWISFSGHCYKVVSVISTPTSRLEMPHLGMSVEHLRLQIYLIPKGKIQLFAQGTTLPRRLFFNKDSQFRKLQR